MRNFTASQQAMIDSTSRLQPKEKPKKRKSSKPKSSVHVSPVKETLSNHALHLEKFSKFNAPLVDLTRKAPISVVQVSRDPSPQKPTPTDLPLIQQLRNIRTPSKSYHIEHRSRNSHTYRPQASDLLEEDIFSTPLDSTKKRTIENLYGYNPNNKNEVPLVVRPYATVPSPNKRLETTRVNSDISRQLVFSDERSASPSAETQDDDSEKQMIPTPYDELHALALLADEDSTPPTQQVQNNEQWLKRSITEETVVESTNATSSPNFINSNHNNHPSPAHSIEYRANREAQTEDVYIYHEDHVFLDNEQDTQSIGASPFIYKMKPTPHKSPSPPEEDTQSIRSSPFIYKMRPTPQKSPSPPQDSQLIQNSPFVAMPTQPTQRISPPSTFTWSQQLQNSPFIYVKSTSPPSSSSPTSNSNQEHVFVKPMSSFKPPTQRSNNTSTQISQRISPPSSYSRSSQNLQSSPFIYVPPSQSVFPTQEESQSIQNSPFVFPLPSQQDAESDQSTFIEGSSPFQYNYVQSNSFEEDNNGMYSQQVVSPDLIMPSQSVFRDTDIDNASPFVYIIREDEYNL